MKPRIFIDGREGTTGLEIYERLVTREDISLLEIDPAKRKDLEARRALLNEAELVFLCLPDVAAREAVSLIANDRTRVIDASTAHRTDADFLYGFPEILPKETDWHSVRRVANPGCHATGFLSYIVPLRQLSLLPEDYPLCCHSITGYSGGGKAMIAAYEAEKRDPLLSTPTLYARGLQHKHLPEMQSVAGLRAAPAFVPILSDMFRGMATSVLLHTHLLDKDAGSARAIYEALGRYYETSALISVHWAEEANAHNIAASQRADSDRLEIHVSGTGQHCLLTALFDNLGKGASGAAVQNMNLLLGFDPVTGLRAL